MLDVARHNVHTVLLQLEIGAAAQLDFDLPAVKGKAVITAAEGRGPAPCHGIYDRACARARHATQAALAGHSLLACPGAGWPARLL